MVTYEFDLERFRKLNGILCPCLIPNRENSNYDNLCPCTEFIETGKCRCMLFKEVKT